MSLPKFKYEYAPVQIEGLGEIEVRPLSRGEMLAVLTGHETAAATEREAVVLGVRGEEVAEWFDSLPPFIAKRIAEAVIDASHGVDLVRLAEKNS